MQQPATAVRRHDVLQGRFRNMPVGHLCRLRREMATGFGLARPGSSSRVLLRDQLGVLQEELDSRCWYEERFPAQEDQARRVRRALGDFLAMHLYAGDARLEDAQLIANELVVNAILHSRSRHTGFFTVRAEAGAGGVLWVEVEDAGGEWVTRPAGDDGTSGRGLLIVGRLCGGGNWGTEDLASGRVVWARLVSAGTAASASSGGSGQPTLAAHASG